MGILIILSGYFLRKFYLPLAIIFVPAGRGAIGVGTFPEYYSIPHTISAFLAFLMISIAPIAIFRNIKNINVIMWIAFGFIGFIALVLYGSGHFLGPGHGWYGEVDRLSKFHLGISLCWISTWKYVK